MTKINTKEDEYNFFDLRWFNELSEQVKLAFFCTISVGLMTHIYKFTNTLLNHDSLFNFYTNQNIVGSGRWFLSIACGFSSYFDLPWINGLLSLVLIALTAVIIVKIFDIKNKVVIILLSSLLVTFPGITETFFFGFTADGYMLAMLFACLAVYFSKVGDNNKIHVVFSIIFVCLSCGIYQSYVSFGLALALCHLMWELLENKHELKVYYKWIKNQIIIYITGLAGYYLIWQICMIVQNVQANAYQGIDQVGHFDFSIIFNAFINTIKTFALFFLEWNVFEHGWTLFGILNIIFLIISIFVIIKSVFLSELYKRKIQMFLFILCLVAFPFFCCIWYFVSSGVIYRPMMLLSISIFYIFIIILIERWLTIKLKNITAIFITLIIFNFGIQANIAYYLMDKCYEASYATALEIVYNLHEINENNEHKVAIIGDLASMVSLDTSEIANKTHMLSSCLENNLMFDQQHISLFVQNILNYKINTVSIKELSEIEKKEEVIKMKNFPSPESIKIVDDVVVIKISDRIQ